MADDAGNPVAYWVAIPAGYTDALYTLRSWPDLRMATADGFIWLRGFSREDLESAGVLRIPMVERYYLMDTHLYPLGKSLPARVAPTLLWTDLRRGLKITLPKENFNYFGVTGDHHISLIPSEAQRPSTATIVDLPTLGSYLRSAPRVRTAPLRWTVLEGERALILGTPLLPIQGQDYYHQAGFLIPAGWKLKYEGLAGTYQEALGDGNAYWYVLNENNELAKLKKDDFTHLSKGSFVRTSQPQ